MCLQYLGEIADTSKKTSKVENFYFQLSYKPVN